jgi:phenylalanyl-tRNA synthetase beta chain
MATWGTRLPSGINVEKREIKGVVSEGIVCSEADLGIGEDKETPFYLPSSIETGSSMKDILELDDIVFEFDVEPNRVDLFSVYGFARELHAIFNIPLLPLKFTRLNQFNTPDFVIRIEDEKLVSRYCALVGDEIEVSSSPLWLQNRLRKAGIKPINNVVDLTNYVMLETGQPLHAFDLDKIEKEIVVRSANKGEIIFTLDGKRRILEEGMCVIADANLPIAIAGIIGGEETSITTNTRRILVESANFNPLSIRKTSRILGLRTESSSRFEKGLPPQNAYFALARFSYLFTDIIGGSIVNFKDLEVTKAEQVHILLTVPKVNSILGDKFLLNEIVSILEKLEFSCKKLNDEKLEVSVPYFRGDVKIEEDLIEEIGRIYGYNKIPYTLPISKISPPQKNKRLFWENITKETLRGCGITEIQTTSLYGDKEIQLFEINKDLHLELENPLSLERKYTRLSLLPQLLFWINENLKRTTSIRLFELGKIYIGGKIPYEKNVLEVGLVSQIPLKAKETDFYEAKAILQILLGRLGIKKVNFLPIGEEEIKIPHIFYNINKIFHPYRTAKILLETDIIGLIGELHPYFLKELGINWRICIFDIDFDKIVDIATLKRSYKEFSPFPSVKEDYSFIFKKETQVADIIECIYNTEPNLISKVELIDIYEGKEIKENYKSLTFSVIFQSYSHTLSKEEIAELRKKIIDSVTLRFSAELRGKI